MNTRSVRDFKAPLSRVVFALLAASALRADTTYSFQNGANGYSGAKDVSINTQYAQYNSGNGVRWTGGSELGVYTVSGANGYTARYLLKFGNLTVPAGSTVVSAKLTLGFDYWGSGSGNLTGYYLKNSWDPASSNTGWIHRDASHDWGAPGASSPAVDTVAGKTFAIPALRAVGNQKVDIPLDNSVIQSWIDTPSANQGFMLINNINDDTVNVLATTGTAKWRPTLTIVVASTAGVQVTVAPPSATVQTGQTKQFTATVTGSSNTAVTWTATGGTISTSGLFTAGSATGNFTVTATSAADSTKSGSAQVTVQAAPAISVSVNPPTATLQPGQTQQFSATVSGTSNTSVTWTATGGAINSSGLFTAGAAAGSFTVTATSAADATKSGSASVTIVQPVSVMVSPTSASVQSGQTKQFTATVTGSSNTAVTWSATGGTITSGGLFTAGSAAGTNFSVTATSVADATKSASATVTVTAAPPTVSVSISPASASLNPGQTKQFSATVTGSSNTSVTWTATGGTISSAGLYTAGQTPGSFSVTATSAADTTKSAAAEVQINTVTSSLPPIPRQFDGPYVVVQSPVSGMHFAAPGTIRIYADPYDPNANDPDAVTVTYLMNGQSVGTFTGSSDRNGYFPFTVSNVAAGTYAITTQITTGGKTYTSAPVTVFVDTPAASSGAVFNLTGDMVLSGTQSMTYAGTASNHCTINGNGFQIRSASGFSGTLNISYCDVRNLGTATNPGINVTTGGNGSIQLIGNVWETFGTVSVAANDTAQLVVRGNEFRENTLVPVTNLPIAYANETVPVVVLSGNSSTQKFFQGNNVGLSTVLFDSTQNWLIGGNTDADSNILIGVRCGFTVRNSTSMVLRGNYSQHNYPHRMSQGDNFQLEGDGFLVEHNLIRDSSWPVRGMGGELRYNIIDSSGTLDQVIQGPMSNTNIHHNVLTYTVNQQFFAPGSGLRVMFNVDNVQFNNNTFDGSGPFMGFSGAPVRVLSGSFIGSLRNNVFYNFAGLADEPILAGDQGESTNPPLPRLRYADYNDFYNPDAPNQTNYGLGVVGKTANSAGYGAHDLGGFNGHANPKFAAPTALPFPFAPQDVWNRVKKMSDILSAYRAMYTPATGSPLINAGDPQDGNPNIGAVGNGEAADQFGKFGNGSSTPAAPVISAFSASPSSISSGQSSILSWSVTGATALSIAPGVGPVTGTSVSVSPTATTTYILTATNAGGSSTAAVTVTIGSGGGTSVSVSISPTSASVASGATRQFTATVSGTSNTAVNWTATGGTVSSSGLFTAGPAAGSFSVTATSAQDSSKSATATVTVTAPASVSVVVNPPSASLFTGGTQQFTATVSNASNTAVTWTAAGGTIDANGLYTGGSTAGSFSVTATSVQDPTKSATATVTLSAPGPSGAHPRIILDTPTLAALRSRMSAHTAEWTRLKSVCDSYIGGTAQFIDGNDYPDPPNVGEGYQGSGYHDAFMPLALCYQTIRASDPTTAAKYAATAVSILMAMSDPNHQTTTDCDCQVPLRDYGFGIRFFGVTMALGYDWFHDVLTPAQLSQLRTALNNWINLFENNPNSNFEYTHPQGNYYAGYYAAKCYAALAVQGDDPIGDTWWNAWYNHEHLGRVVPYYSANLAGGGWTEGYAQYGILATRNQSLPALAVKTAKGIDLVNTGNPATAYTYPVDNPRWLMAFTWPTRDLIDDRGELYSTGDPNVWPGTGNIDTYRFSAGILAMLGDSAAQMMHKYARDAKTALDALGAGGSTEWVDFLFWDPNGQDADYTTQPASYLAPGMGGVTARSDWSASATFMSFMSGPYINNPGAGHEAYDKGSLAIQRNKNPLLVNADAWLTHDTGLHDPDGHSDGDDGWTITFDDRYGNWSTDHSFGNRRLYNTFQVRQLDSGGNLVAPFGQSAAQRSDGARTKIGKFEDGGSYVLAVGTFLQDMYYAFHNPNTGQPTICSGAPSAVTSLTREIVYLRPSQFIVYDRSGICDKSLDQYLAFHFAANPVEVAAPGPGVHRFDVNTGQFAGSMTTILPANAAFATTSQYENIPVTFNKVFRVEIRPTDAPAAARRWMTVFDLAQSSAQVANATGVNVTGGGAVGALLQSASGNSAVLSSSALDGSGISGAISYTVPAAQTHHVITDLGTSAGYSISVVVSGANHMVTISPGGPSLTSANGVLSFQVNAAGQITQ